MPLKAGSLASAERTILCEAAYVASCFEAVVPERQGNAVERTRDQHERKQHDTQYYAAVYHHHFVGYLA